MAIQNQPGFIPAPFANSGTKNVIPETMPTPSASAAASWTDGFPTVCSLPLASGGIPPARADFNGLFNSITQAQAFYQSGGIYEWDATVDYGTNRMILGSDGKLYWSMAQSGPNTGAGAVDPTTDDGTYWGSMPVNAPGVLDRSDKLVSSQWVEDAFGQASIYVDSTSGDDANDGLTAGTAVQTLAQARNLASARGGSSIIYVAGGTYTEDIDQSMGTVTVLSLQGDVTLVGKILLQQSSLLILGTGHTLTVAPIDTSYPVLLSSMASMVCNPKIIIVGTGPEHCLFLQNNSVAAFSDYATVTANNINREAVYIENSSSVFFNNLLTIDGTSSGGGVVAYRNSSLVFTKGIKETNIFTLGTGIVADYASSIRILGTCEAWCSPTSGALAAFQGSTIVIACDSASFNGATTGNRISARYESCIAIQGLTTGINCNLSGNSAIFIHSGDNSCITLNTGTYNFSGTASIGTVYCDANSCIWRLANANCSGTVTGQRFHAVHGGQIVVSGGGANAFPGSSAGTASSASYSFYG